MEQYKHQDRVTALGHLVYQIALHKSNSEREASNWVAKQIPDVLFNETAMFYLGQIYLNKLNDLVDIEEATDV